MKTFNKFIVIILLIICFLLFKSTNKYFSSGNTNTQDKLNNTLLFILKKLNKNNIQNWFVAYGTLLGIIREDSCINGDDDIDIICNIEDYDIIKELLTNNGFIIDYGYGLNKSKNILKTKSSSKHASIDFYMCKIDDKGNFKDDWEAVLWSNCYINDKKLIKYRWKDTMLYLPNNFETKLKNRYGENWKIPQNSKGPKPRKKIL